NDFPYPRAANEHACCFPATISATREGTMKKSLVTAALLLLIAVSAFAQEATANHAEHQMAPAPASVAQDWAKKKVDASPRHHEWVNLKSGTRVVSAFVVYPEVKAKAPAVVVIHEIFGMSD